MYQNIYYERQKNLIHLWDDKSGYQTFPYRKSASTQDHVGPRQRVIFPTMEPHIEQNYTGCAEQGFLPSATPLEPEIHSRNGCNPAPSVQVPCNSLSAQIEDSFWCITPKLEPMGYV